MKRAFYALLLLAALLGAGTAGADDLPANTGFVTDTLKLLSPEQRADVESVLKEYEGRTGTEIAVLIVANTGGRPISDFAVDVANKWGVGKKGVDNGALLVVSMETHKIFIAVGRQLEGAVTDGQAAAIARNVISPLFKQGNYYAGLKEGVVAIQKTIAGESFTDRRMAPKAGRPFNFGMVEYLLFFAVIAVSWLSAILGRSKEIWPGGAIGAVVGAAISWFLGYSLLTIIIVSVTAGAAGLAFDWFVSKNFQNFTKGGPTPPWWMGGGMGGGGFGGGSGGFGGGSFSGGGGGSDW